MTPIERAARALVDNYPLDSGESPLDWHEVVPVVRAVIAAIREPSEAMLDASGIPNLKKRIDQLENSALMAGFGGVGDEADGQAADILRSAVAEVEGDWSAMIDALLEEGR